jgi:hypothetical protein
MHQKILNMLLLKPRLKKMILILNKYKTSYRNVYVFIYYGIPNNLTNN